MISSGTQWDFLPEFLNNSEQIPNLWRTTKPSPAIDSNGGCFNPTKPQQVATNPTHYGNPSTGCESDEQAVRVQGLSGDFCSPKCDSTGSCPSDVPKGDTATPECALRTTTGDKYCALICQSDSDCGSQVAFQMFVLKSMNERDREACTQTFFPCSLTVGMLLHVAIHASWNLWILAKIKYGLGAGGWQLAIRMYPWSWNKSWISTSHQEPDLARRSWVLAFAPMTQVRSWQSKRPWPRPDKHAFLEDYQCWQWLWWETEVLFRCH